MRSPTDMPWVLSDPIRIVVPGPPKAWQRAGHRIVTARDGRQFVSSFTQSQTRLAQANVRSIAYAAMGDRAPLTGAIDCRIVAYMPIPESWSKRKKAAALADQIRPTGKPDRDNLEKLVADAFKEVVWRDDSQITDGPTWKRYADKPRLVIEVRELTWVAPSLV